MCIYIYTHTYISKIEVSSNNNFLDVTLDVSNNSYKPFIKTNQHPSYININSNHPINIIKQVPKAVNLICKLSANEKIFNKSSKMYRDALKNSGFKEKFRYLEENMPNDINKENKYNHKNKDRKRKIICFNPPFCKLASINVGKYFLKLIDKLFKHENILHEIFNKKTFKISYSCTKNISQIIKYHNKEIIKEFQNRANNNSNSKKIESNCKSQSVCPVNGLCNLDNVVYTGIIYPKEDINDRKTYIGISSTKWKITYGNHKYSFSYEHLKTSNCFKHFWGLKYKGLTPEIQWSILKRSNTPKSFDSRCNLCLEEKKCTFCFFQSRKNY